MRQLGTRRRARLQRGRLGHALVVRQLDRHGEAVVTVAQPELPYHEGVAEPAALETGPTTGAELTHAHPHR